MGLFAWTQVEFNLTVLASLLAIIGYSLNDSIIVADRIRELMQQTRQQSMAEIINSAIRITFNRTLITSGTTLVTIACIWWLGGKPLAGFSMALFSGILVGTFSSICISGTFPELLGVKPGYYREKAQKREEEITQTP
jgi:preprotein translocase subunit SecF